jgi:hypothetical protein
MEGAPYDQISHHGVKTYVVEKTTEVEGMGFSDEGLYPASSEVELGAFYKMWNGYGTYQP